MGIGSLGISELMLIFVIVLVFFGPRRFPEIARSMGSAMREFRRSLNQIQRELEEVDPRKDLPGRDILNDIRSGKTGSWLDPNQSSTPAQGTPGARSAPETTGPEVTGEAATTAAVTAASGMTAPASAASQETSAELVDDVEQLPMFDGSAVDASSPAPSEEEPEAVEPAVEPADDPPKEDSRSD